MSWTVARHVAHDPRDERLHALTHILKVLAEKACSVAEQSLRFSINALRQRGSADIVSHHIQPVLTASPPTWIACPFPGAAAQLRTTTMTTASIHRNIFEIGREWRISGKWLAMR